MNKTYAKINTKIGDIDNNVAASDNGMEFMDSL
jgi:hypothetical protein